MKLLTTFLITVFCFLASAAFAQTDSLKFRGNEIGADFLPLLRQGSGTSLLFRRNQQNAAWRARLYGNFRQSFEDDNEEFYRQGSISIRTGREWHHDFRKLQFYYGLDLGVSYHSIHHSVQQPVWFEDHDRTLQVHWLPLLGFGYKIKERFVISAEANGQIGGGRTWQWRRDRFGQEFSFINFDALSEFSLFLSYRF